MVSLVDGTVPISADFNTNWQRLNNEIDTTAGRILTGGGSVTAPTHSYNADNNTGMYSSAANVCDISAGGVRVVSYTTTASGVNYLSQTISATGGTETLEAAGTDTNIGLDIGTKGTGSTTLWSGSSGRELLILAGVASAVNELTITQQVTGTAPSISSTGDDTNIDIRFDAKGSGVLRLQDSAAIVTAAATGTPVASGQYAQNVVKGWGKAGVAADVVDSFNLTSVTDTGTGQITWTWDRDFATTGYSCMVGSQTSSTGNYSVTDTIAVGSVLQNTLSNGNLGDPINHFIMAMGDQA